MPVSDPSSGRLFIWLITSSMFICVSLGVAFLVLYMALPSDPSRAWLPVAGMVLSSLPWGFWLLTCFYRIVSRTFGFRFLVGDGDPPSSTESPPDKKPGHPNPISAPAEGQVATVQDDIISDDEKKRRKGGLSCFRDDASTASHESELHLNASAAS